MLRSRQGPTALEKNEDFFAEKLKNADEMLAPCIDVALQISKLQEFTGRDKPNVIT